MPSFEKIMSKTLYSGIRTGDGEGREDLQKIIEKQRGGDFQNTIEPLDTMGKLMTKVSAVFFGPDRSKYKRFSSEN